MHDMRVTKKSLFWENYSHQNLYNHEYHEIKKKSFGSKTEREREYDHNH